VNFHKTVLSVLHIMDTDDLISFQCLKAESHCYTEY